MNIRYRYVAARSLLVAGALLAGSCGPVVENVPDSQILIVVNVKGIQSGTQSLQVKSSLDGRPDPNGLTITSNTSKFAMQLANDPKNYGQLKIDGFAMDGNQCYLANGQVTEQITSQKTYYELDLTLLPQASPKCSLTVKILSSGSETVTSTPAGISCGGGQSVCSYDFPFGTPVTLNGPVSQASYPVWTGGCTPASTYYTPTCVANVQKGGGTATVDFVPRVCTTDGWCQYHPLGTTQTLIDVWGADDKNLWAMSSSGLLLRSSGGAWQPTAGPVTTFTSAYQVRGSSASNVYALGYGNSGLIRWDGTKWTQQANWPNFPNADPRGLHVIGPNDALVSVVDFLQNKYLIYRFNGTTYSNVTPMLGVNEQLNRMWGFGATDAWVGSSTGIYRWDGTKWTKDASPAIQNKSIQHVWGPAANDVWAATTTELFHFDGTSWTAAAADNGVTPSNIIGIGGGKGPEVWLTTGSASGRFYRYAGGSCSPKCWSQVDVTGVTTLVRSVWGAASNDLWAVGNTGLILHYDGQTWSRSQYQKPPLTSSTLTGAYGVPNNQNSALQIFGPVDTALATDTNNIAAAAGFSTTAQNVYAAYGLAANEIMVVGSNGLVLRYDGATWKSIPSGTTNTLNGVFISNSPRFYYIVGSSGFIARADQTLTNFVPATKNVPPAPNPNTTTQTFYAVGGSSATNVFAASYSGVVYRTGDGTTWNQVLPVPNNDTNQSYYSVFYHPSSGRVYIGGSNGNLFYYSGAPWTQVNTASTASIYSMWGMTGSQAMWIGGTGGTILKFDGTNIVAQKTGVTSTIRTIWGNNLTDVWAAGDSGTILRWKM